jgi:aminoglycoside phosphotransferase (APT) family kinase protein
VHFPLSQQQHEQLQSHQSRLALLRARFGSVPVPQPLWIGVAQELQVACERRLGGLTAPQITGRHPIVERMFADVARDFSTLTMRAAREFDAADFERLVAARFELVMRHAGVPRTIEALAVLREEMRAALVGAHFPLVLQHADLRSKHVQVAPDGAVIGYLDWGSSELEDLPFFDVLHLVAHERKQAGGLSAAQAWRLVSERSELRDYERRTLDDYCARLASPERVRRAIEAMYPVLVAAMAERNWDFSRPRWLSRQFEI